MVWRYTCGFFRILKLFFITGFLLQYLGRWYRTNGPQVNLPIFNTSNKNKAGDINFPWNLLVCSCVGCTNACWNLVLPSFAFGRKVLALPSLALAGRFFSSLEVWSGFGAFFSSFHFFFYLYLSLEDGLTWLKYYWQVFQIATQTNKHLF